MHCKGRNCSSSELLYPGTEESVGIKLELRRNVGLHAQFSLASGESVVVLQQCS
jgi:hypothetical protein